MENISAIAAPWTVAAAPRGLPVFGHAFSLLRRPLDFLRSLYGCGDLVEVRLGLQRVYVVCHPELSLQVLRDSRAYDKGGAFYDTIRLAFGDGLITSEQKVHQRHRRLIQPAFRHDRIAGYSAVMQAEAEVLINGWQSGQIINVSDAMHALTMRIAMATLFSASVDAGVVAEVQWCVHVLQRGMHRRTTVPFDPLHRIPTPGNRQFAATLVRLQSVIDDIIATRRAHNSNYDDLLSHLFAVDESDGDSMADREVHDQVMTLLMAGSETTANALVYCWYLIGKHPEVERRLHAEVDDVLAGRAPAFDDLPRLTYVKQVFTEVLRLYPPVWIFTRTTSRDTELAGRSLAAGTTIMCSPYLLHHDPALFPDPERCDPDRWSATRAGTVPRGAFLPFGGGNRKCIGDSFAISEGVLILAAIASRFALRCIPGEKIKPVPRVSLGTGPLRMTSQARRPPDRYTPASPSAQDHR
ncbi:MAG: cytochrome P450 [Pseudonocardiaceae bacterium]